MHMLQKQGMVIHIATSNSVYVDLEMTIKIILHRMQGLHYSLTPPEFPKNLNYLFWITIEFH